MSSLTFDQTKIPFLLGGTGQVNVDLATVRADLPLNPANETVFTATFSAAGSQTVQLGTAQTVKIGISASASTTISGLFAKDAASPKLSAAGLKNFFAGGSNTDKLILSFEAGAKADSNVAASFSYSVLSASASVQAGINGGYTYLRAFDKSKSLASIVGDLFASMRLPEQGDAAPAPGEAISLQYGGYLKLTAEASAGYRLSGTKSLSLGEMALSENYDLSILGKIGLTANVAGDFSILVTADDALPGWARVRVHRRRSNSLGVAADVKVDFQNQLTNLPTSAKEFVGAVLGVNAKSFLTVFNKAVELSDFDKFEQTIDGLAKSYIAEFTGKAFDQLKGTGFKDFLSQVQNVVDSYNTLGDRAVTLFDRYFDRIDVLKEFAQKLSALEANALPALRKSLNPELWNIFSQLTDGDPLGFLLDDVLIDNKPVHALVELKRRADNILALIENRNGIHTEIRKVVELAKHSFGIDKFFAELEKFDTPEKLQAIANDKLGQFVTRLVGRGLDSSANIKKAFDEVHAVLTKIDTFGANLFKAFSEAANSSWTVALHAEYSRASETDALIDVSINMATASGRDLMRSAGKGDFAAIIANADTDVVRLREGLFTHKTTRQSAFRVSIAGWHLNYQYEGFDRVIVESEQRLVPSDQGIHIDSTVTLETESERKQRDESTHVNFLLRALGESKGVVMSPTADSTAFLIDTLKSLTARYQLQFTDANTSTSELNDYLAFAGDLGLDQQGATATELGAYLPKAANGGFGNITADYDVRFGERAVAALLQVTELSQNAEAAVRQKMRLNLLSNYLKDDAMHDVAFAYATPGVYAFYQTEGGGFTNHSSVSAPITLASGIAAPVAVNLDQTELRHLDTLYRIEDKMIDAVRNLYKLLNAGEPIDPRDFEKALGNFGSAMQAYDNFDQTSRGVGTNSIFVLFDTLVRLAAGGNSANTALLSLKSEVNGTTVEKLFLSDAAVESPTAVIAA